MLGLIAPRRCMGCDEIIEDLDPVYCAADFDLLQKERESEVKTARALYEVTATNYERAKAKLEELASLFLNANENENTADYDAALALARTALTNETKRQAAE